MMWRTDGAGELYTYLPPDFTANQAVCDIPPYSTCNDVYGASVGRGSFDWATGGRTTVSQRVRLNDAGQSNGELQLFVGGKSVVNVGGLVLRNSSEGRIRGMQFQTFFGGETSIRTIMMLYPWSADDKRDSRLRLLLGFAHRPVPLVLGFLCCHHRDLVR